MTETRYGNMRIFRFIIIVFMILMVGMLTATVKSHAGSWHEVYLNPGQTYNVSDAGWNTTVYINKAGSYTLKGESTKCKVVIKSGGVNVYLEDGLEIDPGIKANIGVATAGLIIEDMSGTVKLISKKGADAYIGGYLMAPAIEKVGYNSKLVFETIDPANPGTITAYRSHASNSAGIGSAYRFSVPVTTGNIEINSGTLIATGGYMSAGIGGGGTGSAHKIIINGGNVKAAGGSHGTGIGGGYHGNASNITINGGTVNAESIGEGAGIGSGEQSKYAKNIIINGGNVRAVSDLGAGIGGGQRSEVENLRINGGTIYAYSRNTGIGSSCDQHLGILKSLYITGGTVVAESKGTAIGAASSSPGPNNIYISGGIIEAKGDQIAIGGGGFSSVTDDTRITNVTISGGTIKADGGNKDFGSGAWMDQFNITITGGSLLADRAQMQSDAKDQFGNVVHRTNVTLDGLGNSLFSVQDIEIADLPAGYGLKDVYTRNGMFHPWIPDGTEVKTVLLPGVNNIYEGSVASGSNGTLYKKPAVPEPTEYTIKFDANAPENTASTPYPDGDMDQVVKKYTEKFVIPQPQFSLKGYEFDCWNTEADGSGTSLKAGDEVSGLVKFGFITLYAQWTPQEYEVTFDAKGGSGTMEKQKMLYDQPEALNKNEFTAPEDGMRFAGWMREKALGGTLRADGSLAVNLCNCNNEENKAVGYTLVAQWVNDEFPTVVCTLDGRSYDGLDIELKLDGDTGMIVELSSPTGTNGVYCAPGNSSMPEGIYSIYVNGSDTNKDMNIGPDGDDNFASLEYYSVNVSCDENLSSSKGSRDAVLKGTEVEISVKETADSGYIFDKWTAIECEPEFVNSTSANDMTAVIRVDEKTAMKAISEEWDPVEYSIYFHGNGADSGKNDTVKCALDEEIVLPECGYVKDNYHFLGWCSEIDGIGTYYYPGDKVKDLTSEDDAVVVLYAVWEHDQYNVSFDANGGEGQGPDVQIWTEEEYILSNPGFIKQDHVLVGWNTEADGSGKTYALDESVKDMADAGESILLYAQWEYDPEASGDDGTDVPDGSDNDRNDETDTGDRRPIGLIAGVMIAVLGVIATVLFGRRRRTE